MTMRKRAKRKLQAPNLSKVSANEKKAKVKLFASKKVQKQNEDTVEDTGSFKEPGDAESVEAETSSPGEKQRVADDETTAVTPPPQKSADDEGAENDGQLSARKPSTALPKRRRLRKGPEHLPGLGVETTSAELEKIVKEPELTDESLDKIIHPKKKPLAKQKGSADSVDTAEEVLSDNESLKGKGIKEAAHPIKKLFGKLKGDAEVANKANLAKKIGSKKKGENDVEKELMKTDAQPEDPQPDAGKEPCEKPKQSRKSAPKKKGENDVEEPQPDSGKETSEKPKLSRKSAPKTKGEDEVIKTTNQSTVQAGESEPLTLDKATKGKKSISKKRGADEDKPTSECAAIAKTESLEKSGEDADEEASTTSNKKLSPQKRGSNKKFQSLKRLLQEAKPKVQVPAELEAEMSIEVDKASEKAEAAEDPVAKLESSPKPKKLDLKTAFARSLKTTDSNAAVTTDVELLIPEADESVPVKNDESPQPKVTKRKLDLKQAFARSSRPPNAQPPLPAEESTAGEEAAHEEVDIVIESDSPENGSTPPAASKRTFDWKGAFARSAKTSDHDILFPADSSPGQSSPDVVVSDASSSKCAFKKTAKPGAKAEQATPPRAAVPPPTNWAERHAPTNQKHLKPDKAWSQLREWLKNWRPKGSIIKTGKSKKVPSYPAALITGPPGAGKTAGVRLLAQRVRGHVVEYDLIDAEGRSFMENLAKKQRNGNQLPGNTVVVCNIAEQITPAQKDSLVQAVLSSPSPVVLVVAEGIFTSKDNLPKHCLEIHIRLKAPQVTRILQHVAKRELTEMPDKTCELIAAACPSDLRQAIATAQLLSVVPGGEGAHLPQAAMAPPAACLELFHCSVSERRVDEDLQLLALDDAVPALLRWNCLRLLSSLPWPTKQPSLGSLGHLAGKSKELFQLDDDEDSDHEHRSSEKRPDDLEENEADKEDADMINVDATEAQDGDEGNKEDTEMAVAETNLDKHQHENAGQHLDDTVQQPRVKPPVESSSSQEAVEKPVEDEKTGDVPESTDETVGADAQQEQTEHLSASTNPEEKCMLSHPEENKQESNATEEVPSADEPVAPTEDELHALEACASLAAMVAMSDMVAGIAEQTALAAGTMTDLTANPATAEPLLLAQLCSEVRHCSSKFLSFQVGGATSSKESGVHLTPQQPPPDPVCPVPLDQLAALSKQMCLPKEWILEQVSEWLARTSAASRVPKHFRAWLRRQVQTRFTRRPAVVATATVDENVIKDTDEAKVELDLMDAASDEEVQGLRPPDADVMDVDVDEVPLTEVPLTEVSHADVTNVD
jgi:hypothetical protein